MADCRMIQNGPYRNYPSGKRTIAHICSPTGNKCVVQLGWMIFHSFTEWYLQHFAALCIPSCSVHGPFANAVPWMYIIHYNSIYVSTVAVLYPNQMKHTSLLILPLTSEILPSGCVCVCVCESQWPPCANQRNTSEWSRCEVWQLWSWATATVYSTSQSSMIFRQWYCVLHFHPLSHRQLRYSVTFGERSCRMHLADPHWVITSNHPVEFWHICPLGAWPAGDRNNT